MPDNKCKKSVNHNLTPSLTTVQIDCKLLIKQSQVENTGPGIQIVLKGRNMHRPCTGQSRTPEAPSCHCWCLTLTFPVLAVPDVNSEDASQNSGSPDSEQI